MSTNPDDMAEDKPKRYSFKKGAGYSGMMRLPKTYELRLGGKRIATVQEDRAGGWFWYGGNGTVSYNTAGNLRELDVVEAECLKTMRALEAHKEAR